MLTDKLCKAVGRIRIFPMHFSTTTKVLIVSAATSVALLGILATYLGRRKTLRPTRRGRKPGGRRTRNSMRSPNDILSLAGSKASTNISPGGSVHAFSDRISLVSGPLPAGNGATPVTATQLGVMGMESLETVISYWEDALSSHALTGVALSQKAETEFCQEIQALLDIAYELQDKSELLFLDERSVLYRDDERRSSQKGLNKVPSDPNFDSAESFASALDQIADLREFEEFLEEYPNLERYPLYESTVRNMEEQPIPYRCLRTDMLNCLSDTEYLGKLHCIRLAFQYLFKDQNNSKWVADTGRQILTDLMCLGDKDPKDFLVGYESMLEFLRDPNNWYSIESELTLRNVKAMTFYDIVLDFIILDAFKDLENPPSSVLAVIQNRFLTNSFKETALTTAVWSVLKAKRRLLKVQNGFMAHFYVISEQISPLMAWGFFGPNEHLKQVCQYFRDEMMNFLTDIYNFQKCRYTTVEDLAEDILGQMRTRVESIGVKFNQ